MLHFAVLLLLIVTASAYPPISEFHSDPIYHSAPIISSPIVKYAQPIYSAPIVKAPIYSAPIIKYAEPIYSPPIVKAPIYSHAPVSYYKAVAPVQYVKAAPIVKHVAPATSYSTVTQYISHSAPIVKTVVAAQPVYKSYAVAAPVSLEGYHGYHH